VRNNQPRTSLFTAIQPCKSGVIKAMFLASAAFGGSAKQVSRP